MTYTILPNQTLHDVALMTTGTLENLCAIAFANGYGAADDVAPGTILAIPAGLPPDTNTLTYLAAAGAIATQGHAIPASTFTDQFSDTFS